MNLQEIKTGISSFICVWIKNQKSVTLGSQKLPFIKEAKFEKGMGKGSSVTSWSWNDERGICKIKLSKNADVNLSIIH